MLYSIHASVKGVDCTVCGSEIECASGMRVRVACVCEWHACASGMCVRVACVCE